MLSVRAKEKSEEQTLVGIFTKSGVREICKLIVAQINHGYRLSSQRFLRSYP